MNTKKFGLPFVLLLLAAFASSAVSCNRPHPNPPPISCPPVCPQPPEPPDTRLPDLEIRSKHFYDSQSGEPVPIVGLTEFRLLDLTLENGNSYLTDRLTDLDRLRLPDTSQGFNLLRVCMTLNGNLGRLIPSEEGNYWNAATRINAKAATHGYRIEWVAFCDANAIWGDNLQAEFEWWKEVRDHLASFDTKPLLELGNELDQPINRLATAPGLFDCADGIIDSKGSHGSDTVPPRPTCDYEILHTNDAFEWWRKDHNAMELADDQNVPAWVDERTRPDRDGNLAHHEDAAATGLLLANGGTFHSVSGRDGSPYDDQDRNAALVFLRGIYGTPLFCWNDGYRRRDDLLTPDLLRVYQRGPDDRCIVKVRR